MIALEFGDDLVALLDAGLHAARHGHWDDVAIINDPFAVGAQEREAPDRFELFEGDKDVGFAIGNDGAIDHVTEAHLARDTATALRHAVDFALLDIESGEGRGAREDLAGQ